MRMILKYPGAKWRIAKWIIDKMPAHHSYLEPYFGSGAVFFKKPASRIETINDIDNDVIYLFRCIRLQADQLCAMVESTPYSRQEYENCFILQADEDPFEKARRFLIKCWQSHGTRTNEKCGWKNDTQGREAAYAMRNWYRLPGWIAEIADRLKEVQIENRPATDVIKRFNFPDVLIYADPPYLLKTRTHKQYKHEMTDSEHVELLNLLQEHKGPVMLSGYDSDLYNSCLKAWERYEIDTTAEKGLPRKEILWVKR